MPDKNILVADDDRGIIDLLKEMLEYEDYRVFLASDGKEATEIAQNHPIDVALLDRVMPVMDGLQALREIKAIDKNIEVLVMTAYADIESLNQIMDHGASDYIIKPFHKTDIMHALENALNKRNFVLANNKIKNELQNRIDLLEKDFEQRTRQLRESQVKYKQIIEGSTDAIVLVQDGVIEFVNDGILDLTGYSREEILGGPWVQLLHPEDRDRVEQWHLQRLEGQSSPATYEFRVLRKDGRALWAEINTIRTVWEERPATLDFLRDITDRKLVEEELRESEERFRHMVELSPYPVSIIDKDGRYVYLNPKFTEVMGYRIEDIPNGRAWFRQAFPDLMYRQKAVSNWKSDLERYGEYEVRPREFSVRCKDGTFRDILFRTVTMRDGKQFITYEDVTERKKLELELLKTEKLESLGVLAGGIAHDFNNFLTVITGNISLAKLDMNRDERRRGLLDEAEKACTRATKLTHQLLTFSKGGAPVKRTASIKEVIEESSSFALAGSNVRCELCVPDDLCPAEIDVGQINLVIHNLILNAHQAMPEGGLIKIACENLTLESDQGLPLAPGRYVRISIRDRGAGVPEAYLSKIFDPYFTTKQQGSGLGLSTAYSILKRHDGHLTVESKVGDGSTFHIYLPASQGAVPQGVSQQRRPIAGSGKVLVMDDEEMIRDLAKQMLTLMGYDAVVADDGAQAIELYRRAKEMGAPFDAVILDLTIPGGMGGKAAIKGLLEIDPQVNAIVSSGYSKDPIMSNFKEYGFRAVIAKPYEVQKLSQVLHALIDNERIDPSLSPEPLVRTT